MNYTNPIIPKESITISAYTTVRNPVEMDYPFIQSIRSTLAFADEVVVLDSSDKDDGTNELLINLQKEDPRVKVFNASIDWSAPNHGIMDGHTKALARSYCTGTHCWQFDCDELSVEPKPGLIKSIAAKLDLRSGPMIKPEIIALPVVEFWGSAGKVRLDINLEKPRLSRNERGATRHGLKITHGIPVHLRKIENGLLYAKHGTDTCDYINTDGAYCPVSGFVPPEVRQLQAAARTNLAAAKHLTNWFGQNLVELPHVHHYSWISIERKIKQYRMFWTSFWKAMYNEDRDPRNNPFFPGKTWEEVSDKDIVEMAARLETETSGWIFHQPWDGSRINSMVGLGVEHSEMIKPWLEGLKAQAVHSHL